MSDRSPRSEPSTALERLSAYLDVIQGLAREARCDYEHANYMLLGNGLVAMQLWCGDALTELAVVQEVGDLEKFSEFVARIGRELRAGL